MIERTYSVARYEIKPTTQPSVSETVRLAETARRVLQGIFGRLTRGDSSTIFSGKKRNGNLLLGHQHAFFIPTDENGDGALDHLTFVSQIPFGDQELLAIQRFRKIIWGPDEVSIEIALTADDCNNFVDDIPILCTSSRWRSVTPFVPVRHYKERGKKKDTCDPSNFPGIVLQEELSRRGFPPIESVIPLPKCELWDHGKRQAANSVRYLSWLEFRQERIFGNGKRGLHPGCGFKIEFGVPVKGPIALGYGCHFGLGLFAPI